jgi:hypothetical protein
VRSKNKEIRIKQEITKNRSFYFYVKNQNRMWSEGRKKKRNDGNKTNIRKETWKIKRDNHEINNSQEKIQNMKVEKNSEKLKSKLKIVFCFFIQSFELLMLQHMLFFYFF